MESDPSQPEPAARPQKGWGPKGWRRKALWGVLGTIALVVILPIATRLYLNDDRIRDWAIEYLEETTNTEVGIEELDLSLWSGVEILGLSIGPPKGFEKDLLVWKRVAVHWSLWSLLEKEVRITELAIQSLHANIEQKNDAFNHDAFLAPLLGPPTAEEPETPEADEPLSQPEIPIRVVLESFVLEDISADVALADMQASLEGFGASSSRTAED